MRIKGIDLELNYTASSVGGGTSNWRLLGSRLDENSVLTPGTARVDHAGDLGALGLPENKVTTNIRYARGPVTVFLQERYIDGGENDRPRSRALRYPPPSSRSTTTRRFRTLTDLTFNYSGGKSGATPWETFFTVNNLSDEEPPASTRSSGARAWRAEHKPLRHGRPAINRRHPREFLSRDIQIQRRRGITWLMGNHA